MKKQYGEPFLFQPGHSGKKEWSVRAISMANAKTSNDSPSHIFMWSCFVLPYCLPELSDFIRVVSRRPDVRQSGSVTTQICKAYVRYMWIKTYIHSTKIRDSPVFMCWNYSYLSLFLPAGMVLWFFCCTHLASIYECNHEHSRASYQKRICLLEVFSQRAAVP